VQPGYHAEDVVGPTKRVRRRQGKGRLEGPKALAVLLGKAGLCQTSDADFLEALRQDAGLPACPDCPDQPQSPQDQHAPIAVLGVVAFKWVFKGPVASKAQLLMHGRKRIWGDPWGWLDYDVIDARRFEHAQLIHNATVDRGAVDVLTLGRVMRHCDAHVVSNFQDTHAVEVSGWHCVPLELGPAILGRQWPLLHSVPLLHRGSKHRAFLPFSRPKDIDTKRARQAKNDQELLQPAVPKYHPRFTQHDPHRLLLFLDYTRALKNMHNIPVDSQRCVLAHWPAEAHSMLARLRAAGFKYPSRRTVEEARFKLDVVSMIIQRERFREIRAKGELVGIHIYCDASPVSGHELFGCQFDLFRAGESHGLRPLQLPG
jgi:hypothetical protein